MNKTFTEDDWTDVSSKAVQAYSKSKTLAERAAWNFVEQEGIYLVENVLKTAYAC